MDGRKRLVDYDDNAHYFEVSGSCDHEICLSYGERDEDGMGSGSATVSIMNVRAADDLRVRYDFKRDGWVIYQEQYSVWPSEEVAETLREGWKEVAFVQAWANERPLATCRKCGTEHYLPAGTGIETNGMGVDHDCPECDHEAMEKIISKARQSAISDIGENFLQYIEGLASPDPHEAIAIELDKLADFYDWTGYRDLAELYRATAKVIRARSEDKEEADKCS